MTLDDFLPLVLPRARNCAAPIATQAVRNALIELCRKSLVWKEFQPAITTVLNQTAYPYTPAAGQQVVKLISLELNSMDVPVKDPVSGRLHDGTTWMGQYAYGTLSGFVLKPAQAAGGQIITYSAVAPSNAATTVPDGLGLYLELVSKGALYRLYSSPDLSCFNAGAASVVEGEWRDGLGDVCSDAMTGNTRAAPRVASNNF